MGLSDLESSRDGSGAYNCHRRANERSLVSALERGLSFPLLFVLLPCPFLSTALVEWLVSWLGPALDPVPASSSAPVDVPSHSFNSRCCRSSAIVPVAASPVSSFATGVKAVNRECACNYATWTFYSWYPAAAAAITIVFSYTPLVGKGCV